ncbi:MAG: hypothetical protein HZB91_13690 [Elusimicrobia bacterium]|nr:hypothetical protein [Elusimicrobiota bacterium]
MFASLLSALLALAPAPSWGGALDQACAQAERQEDCFRMTARQASSPAQPAAESLRLCPRDWEISRRGGCVAETDGFGIRQQAFVHPGGWVVDKRCLEDSRISRTEFLAALTAAHRRMDPSVKVRSGGCLGEFNPEWGRELTDAVWSRRVHVSCPPYDKESKTCAHYSPRQNSQVLVMGNFGRCVGPETTGLAGVLFHETLHAAGADNYSTEKHNRSWDMEQYIFVSDRVYGAEATCFWGTDPRLRTQVNILQCKKTVSYDASNPRHDLCEGFNTSFTDIPAGFIKH